MVSFMQWGPDQILTEEDGHVHVCFFDAKKNYSGLISKDAFPIIQRYHT